MDDSETKFYNGNTVFVTLTLMCIYGSFINPDKWIGLIPAAYLFSGITAYSVRDLVNKKRFNDSNSRFHGSSYVITIGIAIAYMGIIQILGSYALLLYGHNIESIVLIETIFIGTPIIWSPWWYRKLDDLYPTYAIYCSSLFLVLLVLFSVIPVNSSGEQFTLLGLALKGPKIDIKLALYLANGLAIICLFLTRLGRSLYGAHLLAFLGLVKFINSGLIFVSYEGTMWGIYLRLLLLMLSGMFLGPLVIWSNYYRKSESLSYKERLRPD